MKDTTIDHELFHKAVAQAGQAVVITDVDGVIEYVNPAFEATTGYSYSEAVGRNPSILKSGKHSDDFYAELWETILAGDVWTAELTNRRKTGELYEINQTIAPITDDDGTITHFVGIESDVTGRNLREQQLMVLNRIFRHNLRNASTIIGGSASILLEELADPELQSHAAAIHHEIADINDLIDETDAVKSFFEHSPDNLDESGVDVVGILADLQDEIVDEYPSATISFNLGVRTCEIHGDERLEKAVREAIDNAVRHNDQSDPTVDVTVTTTADGDLVELQIADNGPGIPEQNRAAIESRLESPLSHSTGVGLWLIYWIVASYGGDVSFAENEPQGSVVTLRLPTIA